MSAADAWPRSPGVGPIGASMLVMKTPAPEAFRSARHFAAWLGLTPKDHSTAGKVRLGVITRAGDEALRSVLVVGATAVIRHAQRRQGRASPWLVALLKRKPPKLAAVALANKIARIAWKLMVTGEGYSAQAASPERGVRRIEISRTRGATEQLSRAELMPDLARTRADGVIDRSKTRETLRTGPMAVTGRKCCLELASRKPSWPAVMCDRTNRPDI